jgi:NADPH-dependent glutamate synthase beta subunit-like oxidoreductase
VLRSIGYRGSAIDGIPFDAAAGVIPNDHGRVMDEHRVSLPGVYVAGWIKCGPRGVIGTNRTCATETIAALLAVATATSPFTRLRAVVSGLMDAMEQSDRVTEAMTHAYVASTVVALSGSRDDSCPDQRHVLRRHERW